MKRFYMALAGLTLAAVPGGGFTVPATGPATGLSPRPTMQRGPGCLGAGVRRARSPACPARSRAALRAASGGSVADDAGVVLNERAEMAIDVLSFDLDGTLWPTQEVVWAANDAMQSFLVRVPPPPPPPPSLRRPLPLPCSPFPAPSLTLSAPRCGLTVQNERYPGTPSAKDVQETMKAIRQVCE